jgi:DUF1680 family protein
MEYSQDVNKKSYWNHKTQFRKLIPPQLGEVVWTKGFWAKYFKLSKDHIIPSTWEAMNNPINSAVFTNFYITAELKDGEQLGVDWGDGDCYKWMEALSYVYGTTGDEKTLDVLDELISVIAQAQAPDGYLCTQIQLNPEKERWSRRSHHELYNIGHLFTSAAIHYEATGKDNFLNIAVKLADYLYTVFAPRPPELAHYGWNPSNIMGLVDLYRVTNDQRYLELAGIFVDMRGSGTDPVVKVRQDHFIREHRGDQNQDRIPLRDEIYAVGHAVTAMYLYSGAADVYAETGESELLEALERIWNDVVYNKMYITGAVGAYHQGISIRGDAVHEAFGRPYELPNATAYNETCANIGNAMFSWRLLNITSEAKYADIIERVIYNSGLSPVSIDGEHFFYTNPLRFYGKDHHLLSSDEYERWHTYKCYCCPTQVARSTAWMNKWAYSFSEDSVWVNIYSGNVLEKSLDLGSTLMLEMETDYPWDGRVLLKVSEAPDRDFAIRLRIPEWAKGTIVKINDSSFDGEITPGSYLGLKRVWNSGDVITIEFPMEVRLVQSHHLMAENRNHIAVIRGPVVYCLESVDLPEGVKVSEIHFPNNIRVRETFDRDMLGGVTVLEMDAVRVIYNGDEALYKSYIPPTKENVSIKMIPYYAWANRGITEMSVWMPLI